MKIAKNRKKSPIISGKLAITGGLAVFLAVGFAGCDSNNSDCKDPYAPQWKVDECNKSGYVKSSNATQSHGGFFPMFFNSGSSSGYSGYSGSTSSVSDNNTTSSSKSSGFFSPSSGHSSGGYSSGG